MRRIAAAVAIALFAALPAEAAAPGCVVLSDAAGDVAIDGVPGTDGTLRDEHLDVRSVAVTRAGQALRLTIRDAALSPDRRGTWRVTFAARGRSLFVTGGAGMWANIGSGGAPDGFFAGLTGTPGTRVTGVFDFARGELLVTAPVSVFGAGAPRATTTLSNFSVTATEDFANVAPLGVRVAGLTLVDRGASATKVTFGRC